MGLQRHPHRQVLDTRAARPTLQDEIDGGRMGLSVGELLNFPLALWYQGYRWYGAWILCDHSQSMVGLVS